MHMPKQKSLSAYRNGGQNCAQSLYTGFQELLQVPHDVITAARKQGGGKAEGGLCGALHAALDLADHAETKKELQTSFEELAGSQQCREIRDKKQLRCDQCVELAATVLAQREHSNC